ncbi:MAG: TolB family protein [Thermoanaerobaculaceae bacterium]
MIRRMLILAGVLLVVSPAAAQYFGKNKVRYDSFKWMVYSTPHFRISFYDKVEPSLPRIASFAESAYDELARKLNFQIAEPIPLIAYATHADFEQTNTIVQFIPEGVGGVRPAVAQPHGDAGRTSPDADLQKLIQHELTHVFQFEILFQGRLGKALTSSPPQWFMEGMASFFADDEDSRGQGGDARRRARGPRGLGEPGTLRLRGLPLRPHGLQVRAGRVGRRGGCATSCSSSATRSAARSPGPSSAPSSSTSTSSTPGSGRGCASTTSRLPSGATRASTASSSGWMPPGGMETYETSPVASPSGDLIAAFSTYKEDVDVVLFGTPDRKLFRNLTRGNSNRYMYLIAQMLTTGPDRGRDLAFSPDGNSVAVFARRERGRDLLILDAYKGRIERRFPMPVDQAMQPAYSQDGKTIAFRAFAGGQADIYLLDIASGAISNLTNDEAYDADPVYTPDGKAMVFTSQSGESAKLFRLELDNPAQRTQLTFGARQRRGHELLARRQAAVLHLRP